MNDNREKIVAKFGVIRHAPTDWNKQKLIQGQKDTQLSDDGRLRAEQWRKSLVPIQWDRVLSSDLIRTVETARIINAEIRATHSKDKRLREQDWGDWVGRRLAQLEAEDPAYMAELEQKGWELRPPGGESRLEVYGRVRAALLNAAEKWPGQTVLTVAHEGSIKCLLYGLMNRKFVSSEPRIWAKGTYWLHWIAAYEGELTLVEANALRLP